MAQGTETESRKLLKRLREARLELVVGGRRERSNTLAELRDKVRGNALCILFHHPHRVVAAKRRADKALGARRVNT